jgi:hypothetical protein
MSAGSSRAARAVRSSFVLALAGLGTLALGGCGGGSDGKTFTVISTAGGVTLKRIDLGSPGPSAGDLIVFDGPLVSTDGRKPAGHVYGTQTSVKATEATEVVQAFITYDFGDGNRITIGGTGTYRTGATGLQPGKTFVRPILGGTGTYAGADGTLTSVHMSNGDYEQTFRIDG